MKSNLPILLLTADDSLETLIRQILHRISKQYTLVSLSAATDLFDRLVVQSTPSAPKRYSPHRTQRGLFPALLLLDCDFPDYPAADLLAQLREQAPHVPVITLIAEGEEEKGVVAIRTGAIDYVIKSPRRLRRLPVAIEATLYRARLETHQARLHKIALELSAELDLERVLPRVVALAKELIGAQAGAVALLDQAQNVITYPYLHNMPIALSHVTVPAGTGLAGHVMTTRQPIVLNDYPAHPAAVPAFVEAGVRGLVAAPLIVGQQVIGALGLFDLTGQAHFDDADAQAVQAVARQAAVAIQNARLYAETRATRDYYNTLLNSLHDEIIVINRDYIITEANEPVLRKTGHTREEVIGRHCYEIAHQIDSPCWQRADHPCPAVEVWRTGRPAQAAHLHYDKTGRTTHVNVVASPLFDETGQIIGAVESCRDMTAEKRLEERLEAIYRLGQELTLLRDEAVIARRVLETAVDVLQFEVAACGLVDEDAGELTYCYLVGAEPEAVDLHLPLDGEQGIGVAVVRGGRAINVPDVTQDARYVPGSWEAGSALCVPMRIGERIIGVLNAESAEASHFTLDDERLLQTLADQAAIALENARLYQAERARRQELEAVQQASLSLTASLELNYVLNAIARAAFNLISASNADIFLYSNGHLVFGADMRAEGAQNRPYATPRPEGLTYTVARRGETIVVPNMKDHPLFANAPPDWKGSIVGLPLKIGERVVGVMNVARPKPGPFSEAELRALRLLADQAAIAIENARLYQAERARRQELEAIQRASLSLTASLELPQVLDSIVHVAFDLVSAQDAHIFLYAEGRLTFGVALWADGRRDKPFAEPRPNGLTYTVAREGKAIIVPDMRTHPLFADAPPDWEGAIVGLPLKIGERVVGVMNVARLKSGPFSEAELRALRLLADQAAIAIENARLHAETERRAEHLAVLHELDRAITASLHIDDVYHAFARHAARLLPYSRMSIALLEGDKVRITYVAGKDETSPPVGATLPRETSAIGWVTAQGQPLLRHNIAADIRFAEDEQLVAGGIRSSMVIPLWVKGRVIGTWNMGSRQVGAYTPDDLEMARTMADQLAIAIENARLHEDLQAQLDALQAAQARLVQSEKLAAIGELVAGVAHELNNPLTSIIGFAQLLHYSDVSAEARHDLDKIVAQAQRAAGIVRSLLDFARQRPPERKPVQINDVLDATLDLLAYELRTHNVDWTTHFASDLPLTMADPHQLQQVFVNLVHNARQAMSAAHAGGHLTITTELASSTFINRMSSGYRRSEAAPVIRITIQDDGPGIPPHVLPRIFDPFFTTKPPGEGTGLGLSVCHGIVSEHSGHIWAESEPGQGTTFFVELPVVAPEVPRRPSAADWVRQAVSTGTIRILVVDDEVEILEMLVRVLQREGYQVDAVRDGETALARLAETRYDLILCDVRMPGVDGPEIYRRVKAQEPELAQCIIFTTGDTISPATHRFLEEINASYLSKPFELADLIEKVRAATARG